jgi:outer membrane protein OmpA-like peptidoglycan-associated protein
MLVVQRAALRFALALAPAALAAARAAEVKRLLVERGVPESQLRTQGFGSSRPLSREPALQGIHRRVTFVVEGE